jgi:hypothetical protein
MIPLRMAAIGGFSGPRGSMFQGTVTDSFRLGSSANPRQASLGATGQSIYEDGKKQIVIFDDLIERTKHIGNKQARQDLIDTYGLAEPDNKDKALYMRNATVQSIAKADSYTPINYYIFEGPGPDKNRPRKLGEFNAPFAKDVKYAEDTYGSIPDAQIIEKTTTISQVPGWVMPVTIGAVAIAALAAFGVFSGK